MSNQTVMLRERVKLPPSAAMIDSYYRPNVTRSTHILFELELWIHVAHARMLERQGIVTGADIGRILGTLLELRAAGPEALAVDYTQEDLYSYTERFVIGRLGPEVGGRMHTGRSRNDLHTTSWRMALRQSLLEVIDSLMALRRTVLDLARQHADTVMPGYTHTQHAQPISLGYYMLSLADLLGRDFERLSHALDHVDRCPLGSGALTTTAFPIDRAFTAEALGFSGLVEVAYDGVSCRDDAHEAAAALTLLMTNLSRLATDLQSWSTAEYRFIELGDQHSAVSSIMPQKKNPAALEHTKAAAGMVTGALVAALSCSKNTSLSDVNDGVSAINEPVLDAALRTRRILVLLTEVLKAITVFPEVMRRSAEVGFGTATELADVIVRETGLSFRMAHNIVAMAVRETIEAGKTALDISAQDLRRIGENLFGNPIDLEERTVREALDPGHNIRIRTIIGGPAPDNVRAMAAQRQQRLDAEAAAIRAVAGRIEGARERTFAAAQAELAA